MRTSLNEIRDIEEFLNGNLPPQKRLLFQAKIWVDKILQKKMSDQQEAYSLVKLYGRKQLRQEINSIENKLFQDPEYHSFRQSVLKHF